MEQKKASDEFSMSARRFARGLLEQQIKVNDKELKEKWKPSGIKAPEADYDFVGILVEAGNEVDKMKKWNRKKGVHLKDREWANVTCTVIASISRGER